MRHTAYSYLRHSTGEEAGKIVRAHDSLSKIERENVTIDYYIAATKVDFHKLFGQLAEQISAIDGTTASIIAAANSPEMMRAAVQRGGRYDGHQDTKLVLQTAGVAPVPKNQVTNINVRDSIIDNRKQTAIGNINVPTLDEVVRDIDAITVPDERRDARDVPENATLPVPASE